ncbi:hypothetical protein [Bacillus mycoides]|uniref:Uncharacterized protein n=1 Tax=Bacillus mycoides TaxID=1405 RepID=A0A4V5TPR2_BACMY|nr:hypothetical protein [Bacillus mycoides]TKI80363.1 hypothetical protein FC701_28555 [Bacillus mycoides]
MNEKLSTNFQELTEKELQTNGGAIGILSRVYEAANHCLRDNYCRGRLGNDMGNSGRIEAGHYGGRP